MILNIPGLAWEQLDVDFAKDKVTFSACKDDFGDFKFDKRRTEVKPNPVRRGEKLKFKIEG